MAAGILRGEVNKRLLNNYWYTLNLVQAFLFINVCVCVYLWWPFGDGFIAQGLQGLHCSAVSGCLAGASLTNKLMTPHRQLHIEDLRNRIMVPGMNKTTERGREYLLLFI